MNISSVNAHQHQFGTPGYAATKAGILGLTRQIALDYGGLGIRCNAVLPGATKTPRCVLSDSPERVPGRK